MAEETLQHNQNCTECQNGNGVFWNPFNGVFNCQGCGHIYALVPTASIPDGIDPGAMPVHKRQEVYNAATRDALRNGPRTSL